MREEPWARNLTAVDGAEVGRLEHVDVDHPAEQSRIELAADGVARRLGVDRTLGAEHRVSALLLGGSCRAAALGQAPIHVLVPVRDAKWNARVQAVEARPGGRRVHSSGEMKLSVRLALVEDRRRLGGVEAERGAEGARVVREVKDALIL